MRKYPQRAIFGYIIVLVLILWGLYGFMKHIDPTHKLLFYPNIQDKNTTYIFPAFDQNDIFLEKKPINFKTLYPMLGNKLNEFFREKYEFSYIKRISITSDETKYLIYNDMNIPYAYIVTDNYAVITGISGVYLSGADLGNKYLKGMYIEEINRLQSYLSKISDRKPTIKKSDTDKSMEYLSYKTNDSVKYHNRKSSLVYTVQIKSDNFVTKLSDLAKYNTKSPIDIIISIEIKK